MGAELALMRAGATLVYDWVENVQSFVNVFILVYILLIFAYIITSWIRLPYSMNPVQRFLHDVVEPYLRVFRRFLPPLGPLDLSPVVAVFVLELVRRTVLTALEGLR
jgi:uncharacterized protein YggT (Ycf19 family)